MARFLLRRLGQMLLTVAGVLLLTFVLFHLVGGSPAALALGQHAAPRALEDYDELRGFNKPLLWGRWTGTRALGGVAAGAQRAADWTGLAGWRVAAAPACVRLDPGRAAPLPLAFDLRPSTSYRLVLRYRTLGPGATAVLRLRGGEAGALPAAADWRRAELVFASGAAGVRPGELALAARGGALEVRAARLWRGMAVPWDSQGWHYLAQLARLDLGVSTQANEPVARLLWRGLGPSLALTAPIFCAGLVLALALALVCAFFRNTWLDRSLVVAAVALMSVNYLVWIVAGQYWLGFRLGWFPVWGFASWHYLLLPVLVGVVSGLGADLRFYRTIMLDEMYREYVRTAFAKGAGRAGVLFRHVLRNALIPVIANVATALPFLFTGSLLLESFFGIPGLGCLSVNAIDNADVDVVRAVVLIGALLFVLANLAADLCYAWADPRVRVE